MPHPTASGCQSLPSARHPRIALTFSLLLFLLLLAIGCSSPNASPQKSQSNSIDEIQIMSMPVALNLDTIPGVDGFAVKIYPINRNHPKSIPIANGALSVLLFDGIVDAHGIRTNTPLRVWEFPAKALPDYGTQTIIGYQYSFTLAWGTNTPLRNLITVAARYQPPAGPPAYSAPTGIPVASQ